MVEVVGRLVVPLLQSGDGKAMRPLLMVDVANGAKKAIDLVVEVEPVGFHLLQQGIQLLAHRVRTVPFRHGWRSSGRL